MTDPAHEARSLAMARALGIDAHGSPTTSGSGSSLTAEYVARETGGLLYFWLVERWGVEPARRLIRATADPHDRDLHG